ncbi:MAG: hypothetical protein GF387_00005, partial [Candidatus Portnoybacteria bacterium]|nr:hypothetical protein [Candidatus Portnoybacteria bacterium]
MCGIFGITIQKDSDLKKSLIQKKINDLFKLSKSRGKEAGGIAIHSKKTIHVYKEPISPSKIIKQKEYKKLIKKALSDPPIAIIGHSRLVTDGIESSNENNQPVIKSGIVGAHNGIITNTKDLFKKFSIKREYDVDTEIILGLIKKFSEKENSLVRAIQKTFYNIKGSASLALLFKDSPYLILATNTGSLYVSINKRECFFIFASEKNILKKLGCNIKDISQVK